MNAEFAPRGAPGRRLVLRLFALGVAATLGACATPGEKAGVHGSPAVDRFEMNARVAVRFGSDGYTGTLRWRHSGRRDAVDLYTPVGTLHARLLRDEQGAAIEMADGRRDADADAGVLSRRVLGWELPLDALPYWVFSRPAPVPAPDRFDVSSEGRPALLQQGGWRVSYQTFFEGAAQVLPERLELDRPGLKVKLIVSRWGQPGPMP